MVNMKTPNYLQIVIQSPLLRLALVAFGIVLLAACGGTEATPSTAVEAPSGSSDSEFYLNPYKDECLANGELKLCYVARRTTAEEFAPYAGEVENLEYEWGYGYALTGSGDANVFRVSEVTNKTAEPPGTQFPLTLTGGGGRIVQVENGLYEFYGERTFTCDPTASCETLDRVITREQPITFKFQAPASPGDPLVLLSWDSEALPAQVGEEPGLLMQNAWQMQSFTVSMNEQQVILAGTEITAAFELDDSFSTGTISGNAGCNDYSAAVTISGNTISISDLNRGDVQCNNPPGIMEQEQLYLSALTVAQDFAVDGDRLQINYNSGDSALNLIAAE